MTKKVINKILNSRICWIIFSILVAMFLWLYVVRVENPELDSTLTAVPVTLTGDDVLLEDRSLMVTDVSASTLQLKVNGKRADVITLNNSNVEVIVDVSGIKTVGTYTLPYTIEYPSNISNNSITLETASVQNITVTIEAQAVKTVNVKGTFVGNVEEGYQGGNMKFSPDTIKVSGPQDVIDSIAYAYIELSGTDIDSTLTEIVPFKLMDENGEEVNNKHITTSVTEITATLPVAMLKEVYLTVDIVNGGGATSANVKINSDPESIILAGDPEVMSGLNQIVLGSVDLSQVNGSYTKTYEIVLPNNTESVTGETEATVTVEITGLETAKFITTNFEYINSPADYTVSVVTQNLEVVVRGSEEDVAQVASNNIRVVADLTDLGKTTGVYLVKAKVYIDGFPDVGVVGTYNIVVDIG